MKKFLAPLLAAVLLLSSCNIVVNHADATTECEDHDFAPADCTAPAECRNCGLTRGKPAEHTWETADCVTPASCSVCHITEGEPAGHSFVDEVLRDATCSTAGELVRTCSVCGDSITESFEKPLLAAGEVFAVAEPSVCMITSYGADLEEYGFGTGFVIAEDGQIITNYHVIEGADSVTVEHLGKSYEAKEVLAYDKVIDLAVLKIDARGLTPLELCKESHSVGSKVYAVGHSGGLENTFSEGIVTYASRIVEDVEHVQHSAAISSGNSGGPLLNEYGEVIGINTFMLRDAQNLNFAVSVKEIDNLAKQSGMTVADVTEKECDAHILLGRYIMQNGDYLSEDGFYYISTETVSDGDYDTFRSLLYYTVDDSVSFLSSISDTKTGFSAWTEIFVDDTGTPYYWEYTDSTGDYLAGVIDPARYNSRSVPSVSDTNITDEDVYDDTVSIADILIYDTLCYMDNDLADAGMDSADFGFVHF